MPWVTPSALDYPSCGLAPAEYDAIKAAVTTSGITGEEVFAGCVTKLVNHIRGVLGRGHCRLGLVGTIPDELQMTFEDLLRRMIVNQLPLLGKMLMAGDRQALAVEARDYLAEIAKDARGFSIPEEAAPEAEQPAGPSVSLIDEPESGWNAGTMNGL